MASRTPDPRRPKKSAQKPVLEYETPEPMPSIPPGEYTAICYRTDYGRSWGGRRDIYIRFRIIEGEYSGTELPLICTAKVGEKMTTRWKLYKQWCLAVGGRPRPGRFNKDDAFVGKMYRIYVRYTKAKHELTKRTLPDYLQYSVVDAILETLTGVPMESAN